MRSAEAASQAGVTVRALRYYERLGLIAPGRLANGYRCYRSVDVLAVQELRSLVDLGVAVAETRPFVECIFAGHPSGDACPESWISYRRAIDELTLRIDQLSARRDQLSARLDAAVGTIPAASAPPLYLSAEDERSQTDSSADAELVRRLSSRRMPTLTLPSTAGEQVLLGELGNGRTVLYLYPLTGRPGVDLPAGWDSIPGARGCTAEACGFRDHHEELVVAGAQRVFGISSQPTDYQREVVARLNLPFAMLSDDQFTLSDRLQLPTFDVEGQRLYRRLTLIVRAGEVEHVFYPVPSPERHAEEVIEWLTLHPCA